MKSEQCNQSLKTGIENKKYSKLQQAAPKNMSMIYKPHYQ